MATTSRGIHLRLNNLSKSFGVHSVLKELNVEVQPGEFVAIVGRSGCGKSTLLRLITGLIQPTAGQVMLDDRVTRQLSPHIRMMFQDSRLLPWQKVLANVELGLIGHSVKKEASQESARYQARTVLESVGLSHKANDWPGVLSGGQSQRVALARALVSKPRLLLLDEPLGALDALTRAEMQQLLEKLWQEQGFTAILITHDVEEAVTLADRVIVLEEGGIALEKAIDLPRPRQRGNVKLVGIVEEIIEQILGKTPSHSEPETSAPALLASASR